MLQFRFEFAPLLELVLYRYVIRPFSYFKKELFKLGGSEAEFIGRVDVFAPIFNQPNIY
jgi:hypothetical protein